MILSIRRDAMDKTMTVVFDGEVFRPVGPIDLEPNTSCVIEIGNALSATNRQDAVQFIELCYRTRNIHVVSITTTLLLEALDLYRARPDKAWGLTDCISFVVMRANGLSEALTSDHHFRQAG